MSIRKENGEFDMDKLTYILDLFFGSNVKLPDKTVQKAFSIGFKVLDAITTPGFEVDIRLSCRLNDKWKSSESSEKIQLDERNPENERFVKVFQVFFANYGDTVTYDVLSLFSIGYDILVKLSTPGYDVEGFIADYHNRNMAPTPECEHQYIQ
jgi:hypothetical protein